MIFGFPIPYPEEAFYSAVARCGVRYGFPNRKTLLKELFGTSTIIATLEVPCHLNAFTQNLPAGHPFASIDEVLKHTLLGWYSPFIPQERVGRLRDAMLGAGGQSTAGLVGLQASRIRLPKRFRYCAECFRDDETHGRDVHWRQLHQITGIDVCPIHNQKLSISSVERLDRVTRHAFEPATWNQVTDTDVGPNVVEEKILGVAKLGHALISQPWPTLGLEKLNQNLLHLVEMVGYRKSGGNVRMGDLMRDVHDFYPVDYLTTVNGSDNMNWLERLLRNPRGVQSPIRFLLLLNFLGASLKDLFQSSIPTLSDPGPKCERHGCASKGDATSFIANCRDGVRLYKCDGCETTFARRLGCDSHWIHDFGSLWRRRLTSLWNNVRESLRSIAKTLGVDPLTVKRHALKCGLKFPRVAARETTTRGLKELSQRRHSRIPELRKEWLAARRNNPDFGCKAVRKTIPAVYAALYRNDIEWLRANLPPRKKSENHGHVDWNSRDTHLCSRIAEVARQFYQANGRPQRVTETRIWRAVGALSWMKKAGLLPQTRAAIAVAAESRIAFAKRRIAYVARRIAEKGWIVTFGEFIHQARVRADLLQNPELKKYIDQMAAALATS